MVEFRAATEVRLDGRTLVGSVMQYGSVSPSHRERFEPRSLRYQEGVKLNIQHDAEREIGVYPDTLELRESRRALDLVCPLRDRSAELSLVRRGALGGLSVEFIARRERREGAIRVIEAADLVGIGLVDRPSFPTSKVEIRQLEDAWLRATISYANVMQCECQGPTCGAVEFLPGAFGDPRAGILAVGGGGFANVLGSIGRGTLLVEDSDDALRIGLTDSATETARSVVDAARVADIYVRPILDLEESVFTEINRVRTFTTAAVRAWLVKPTDASDGHIPAVIEGVEQRRRQQIWL